MIIAIVAVVLIILIWFISTDNQFKQTKVKIEEAHSGIEIALEKRFDSVKQCFASAKNFMDQQHATIVDSLEYRKGMSVDELSSLNNKLAESVSILNAVAEKYPDVKGDMLYAQLQNTIIDTEDNLAATRRLYNSNVTIYNQLVVSFPSSIVSGMKHYQQEAFFKGDETKAKGFEIPM